MSQYGILIESIDTDKEELYRNFSIYFKNPIMYKTNDRGQFSVYKCKTYCNLSNQCRYIVAMIPDDHMPIGTQEYLITMKWTNLQTRTWNENHKFPPHSYIPTMSGPLCTPIRKVSFNDEVSTYKCEKFPYIVITMLHTKKGSKDEYQPEGNLIRALETYETIISFA